ncbi:unnamed protein product [Lymnaea stagnalis]|uniref:TMC domain-containing protein n=1 Tax=Lymnaea stagnalis TaxID=6523 RepID=A0AAV2I9V0_LYMST
MTHRHYPYRYSYQKQQKNTEVNKITADESGSDILQQTASEHYFENGDGDDHSAELRHRRNRISVSVPPGVMAFDGMFQQSIDLQGEYDEHMSELLQQLPSRQLEDVADMAARTLLRKRTSHIHRATIRLNRDEELEERIVESIELDLSSNDELAEDLGAAVRTIPTTLSKKRNIKRKLTQRRKKPKTKWLLLKYHLTRLGRNMMFEKRRMSRALDLWRSHLLIIEGSFGTSVVSYFIFLKWVLLINIPVFLLTFCFLVIPQILFRWYQKNPAGYKDAEPFRGIELLTGTGYFENTEMYYGFYTNQTVEIFTGSFYKMNYAYILTCSGYYILCLLILGYSYLRSYRKYYIEAGSTINMYYFNLVVSGWDYGITSTETSELKHRSLYNEFKEILSGSQIEHKLERDELVRVWMIRGAVWMAVICLLALCGYATFEVSTSLSINREDTVNATNKVLVSPLAMPVVLSLIQLFVPMIFTFLEAYEAYQMPKYELYVHMFREMALKATMLAVLVFFWLDIAPRSIKCWETFVGEELYRLVVIDLLFALGYSFFMEYIRKLIAHRWAKVAKAEFAIGRHTLDLVYSQSLCWLGIFYSPLLPAVVIMKLVILFYVKRYSVVHNCSPSVKPWRASRTHTIFVGYLFIFFILSCVAVGFGVFLIKPSDTCGPYQNFTTTYEVIYTLIDSWKAESPVMKEIFAFIDSPGFIAGLLIFFFMVLYYTRTISLSHKAMVDLFKLQLISEGKDKKFLMNLLNQVKIRGNKRGITHPGPALLKNMESCSALPGES